MTSDKGSSDWQALQYILGKNRIRLSALTADEFNNLLLTTLQEIDLRELRNFKPLKNLLYRRPGSFICGQRQNPLEYVEVGANIKVQEDFPKGRPLDLGTHVVSVTRGAIEHTAIYRRYESGEETTDYNVAAGWQPEVYIRRVDKRILIFRRPNDHTRADDNLFDVRYSYEKVPHEDKMEVGQIRAEHVPLDRFRERFGLRYGRVAQDLIWELASLARVTLSDLQNQVNAFQPRAAELERLSNSIME